ncbi:MAG: aminotransferase class I/II-fold pyridoxal phosphate-dependent enzyme [Calditrichaeota bacterium]|nr:MAG: aminotransferase class I/II-fold pyridoxal phosphate-dependent enzyme [Calditrichota bacterium]
MKKPSRHALDTALIHAGEPSPRIGGAVSMPIFQSANFEYAGETDYHDLKYIRLNNTPNHLALHQKLAALENGEAALVTASGMAAISTTLLTLLKSGDHALFQNTLYGGTYNLVQEDLPPLGITFDFIDGNDPASWEARLRPNTRLIYVETMTNPLLQVADLKAIVNFARANNLTSVIDNTFASPVNFRPLERGFDLSLHSCTKYLNGHSDIVAGAVIGRKDLIQRITHRLNHLGGSLDPHACFLLHRGLKTLALRVRRQNENAMKIAQFLESHPRIARVNYPGLSTHPEHHLARELFDGFGGMLSFELHGGAEAAEKFMNRTTIPIIAPSLGGVETLLTRPATTSHAGMPPRERDALGITQGLVRMSVGIEAAEDLIEDLSQALS